MYRFKKAEDYRFKKAEELQSTNHCFRW